MKRIGLSMAVVGVLALASSPRARGDYFVFEGFISAGSGPVTGLFDFEFRLFDQQTGGSLLAGPVQLFDVPVTQGLFTVLLDFGDVFTGIELWVEVKARLAGAGSYRDFGRIELIPVPYAHYARACPWDGLDGVPAGFADGVDNDTQYSAADGLNLAGTVLSIADEGIVTEMLADGAVTNVQIGPDNGSSGQVLTISGSSVVWADPSGGGLTLPFVDIYGGAGDAFGIRHTGTTGHAAKFDIQNDDSFYSALVGRADGHGAAISGTADGIANDAGYFVVGSDNVGSGVEVQNWGNGWSAYFFSQTGAGGTGKGVYISAASGQPGLQVANGSKNAVVPTSQGARELYSEESSEVWFSDYGFGQVEDGQALIEFDPIFAETVNTGQPYHVFLQAYGDGDLYVSHRANTWFEVRSRAADTTVNFSYRLVAKRRGFEENRLDHAPWADNDPNLYPEKRTQGEAEHPGLAQVNLPGLHTNPAAAGAEGVQR